MGKDVQRAIAIGGLLFFTGGLGYFSLAAQGSLRFAIGMSLRSLGTSLVLGGLSQAMAKTPRQNRSPQRVNAAGADGAYAPLLFGKLRVYGHVVAAGVSGTNNEKLHYAIVQSGAHIAGISDIQDIWLDSTRIPDADIDGSGDVTAGDFAGAINVRRYLGTDGQTVDATLNTELGAQWNSTDTLKGLAYTAIQFTAAADDETFREQFPNGPQVVSALAYGCLCYDPRLDSTNGGSGSHRPDDPDTWAYSNNNALVGLTYLLMRRLDGGPEFDPDEDFDYDSFATAADDCDTDVTVPDGLGGSTTQNRYSCNILLDTNDTVEANLGRIASGMAGAFVRDRGKWFAYAGVWSAATATIDDDWLAGEVTVSTHWPIDTLYNVCTGSYLREDADYAVQFAYQAAPAAYQTQDDGQELPREVDLSGVTDEYHAQRLLNIRVRQSRQQETVELELNMRGWDLDLWRVYTLQIDEFGIDGTYRLVDISRGLDGVKATFQLDDATVWASAFEDYVETDAAGSVTWTDETPPTPTGVAALATDNGVLLSWDQLPFQRIDAVEVHEATSSGGTFTLVEEFLGTAITRPLAAGTTRYYKVRTRLRGTASPFSSEVSATSKTVADGATVGADWPTNLSSRPPELTDGRVSTALNGSGQLQSAVTASATVNGIAASTVTSRANDGWNLTQVGGGTRLADARAANQLYASNVGARQSVQPLSALDVGNDVTVTVDSYTLTAGSLSVSVTGGTVTGLNFLTTYDIAFDDATLAGGAVTHAAYTGSNIAAADGRVNEGQIITPDDLGELDPVPGSGGGGYPP